MAAHQGACVSCHVGTDSALALAGRAEWLRSALIMMGVESGRAARLIRAVNPGGGRPMVIRVCADCAAPGAFLLGVVAFHTLPVAYQYTR
jgi:hypothetical protein